MKLSPLNPHCFHADNQLMSNIVILFADSKSSYIFDKAFDGKSAFEMALLWAKNQNPEKIVVFGSPENEGELRDNISSVVKCGSVSGGDVDFVIKSPSEWTIHALMAQIKSSCEKYGSDYALYAWADCPFLNNALTKDIIEYHTEYASEYTFSEGFPYGFAPEAIDAGVARIL